MDSPIHPEHDDILALWDNLEQAKPALCQSLYYAFNYSFQNFPYFLPISYSYFIPMPSPIIPVLFLKFYCVSDNEVHSII